MWDGYDNWEKSKQESIQKFYEQTYKEEIKNFLNNSPEQYKDLPQWIKEKLILAHHNNWVKERNEILLIEGSSCSEEEKRQSNYSFSKEMDLL